MTALLASMVAVQTGPLIVAVISGLALFVVVMFFSTRARRNLRAEIQSERAAESHGEIGPAERRAKWTMAVGLVVGPLVLILGIIAAVSVHNHGSAPVWDRWLIGIFFWGGLLALLIRFVIVRARRRWPKSPPS